MAQNPPAKYLSKYRISSARLQGYDYSQEGCYFITICTKNRENFFGTIVDGSMKLSPIGHMIANEWQKTTEIRSNVYLGAWVVMPNHFHVIVIIKSGEMEFDPAETHSNASEIGKCIIVSETETHSNASLRSDHPYKNAFGPQSNNISAIIRGFKGATTKQIHEAWYSDFDWQPRFHDHIIRNAIEGINITEYIKNNPTNWKEDTLFDS